LAPRVLIVHDRLEEAQKELKRCAQMNGIKLKSINLTHLKIPLDESRSSTVHRYCPIINFPSKELIHLALLCLVWMMNSFIYYGLALLTPELFSKPSTLSPNDPSRLYPTKYDYLTLFLTTLGEFPGAIFLLLTINRIRGKWTQVIALAVCACVTFCSSILSGVSSAIGIATINSIYITMVVMLMLARAGIFASYSALSIYTADAYPTRLRSTTFGLCNSFSRIAGITTPFLSTSTESKWIPLAVYGGCALLGTLLITLFLREHEGMREGDKKYETT
jgi:OCT family organic cation transporter-like MFS transporter 4/5